jgi:hypothetical protein
MHAQWSFRECPTEENPNPQRQLILNNLPRGFSQSGDKFDRIDAVTADIHASIKKRDQGGFDSDAQLEEWLAEDNITATPEELRDAILQLEIAGWVMRPHREREWGAPLGGYLVSPSWMRTW